VTPRRTLPIFVLLLALALAATALGIRSGGAGHNPPTRKLEGAFKVALYERSVSQEGCYPEPARLAKILSQKGFKGAGVVQKPESVGRRNVVFVVKQGNTCGHLRMALRSNSGLYILNSSDGSIRVAGRRGFRTDPGESGPARNLTFTQKTFRLDQPEQQGRLDILCPGKGYPLGGGLIVHPLSNPDGEGLYPHSYERLGAQRGYHISVILFDGNPASTTARQATIQVVCARGLIPANPSPHKTVFIKQGEHRSATARCPKGQYLVTGGFQRTDFGADGGNYVTESRAVGPRAWKVTGSAFPLGGGELTAIAYCVRHKGPILTEVSNSAPVPAFDTATATTPKCPEGLRMTSVGFSENGSTNGFIVGAAFNDDGTSSATAYGRFGPVASLTAFAYCMRIKGG
jgi:hypothetical protein